MYVYICIYIYIYKKLFELFCYLLFIFANLMFWYIRRMYCVAIFTFEKMKNFSTPAQKVDLENLLQQSFPTLSNS